MQALPLPYFQSVYLQWFKILKGERLNICCLISNINQRPSANLEDADPQRLQILWWRDFSLRPWWEAHISSSSAACLPICASHPEVPSGLWLCAMKPSHLPTWTTWKKNPSVPCDGPFLLSLASVMICTDSKEILPTNLTARCRSG